MAEWLPQYRGHAEVRAITDSVNSPIQSSASRISFACSPFGDAKRNLWGQREREREDSALASTLALATRNQNEMRARDVSVDA